MPLFQANKLLKTSLKTKIWATIAALIATILLATTFSSASLSDVSTFGILLVALQALHFTQEQSLEWRRREASATCKEIEDDYIYIAKKIFDMYYTWNHLIQHEDENKNIEKLTKDEINKAMRLCDKLEKINIHFQAMGKERLDYTTDIFRKAVSISTYTGDINLEKNEERKEIAQSMESFCNLLVSFERKYEERHTPAPAGALQRLKFLGYIREIDNLCISKAR